jgi:hypothetical protein
MAAGFQATDQRLPARAVVPIAVDETERGQGVEWKAGFLIDKSIKNSFCAV